MTTTTRLDRPRIHTPRPEPKPVTVDDLAHLIFVVYGSHRQSAGMCQYGSPAFDNHQDLARVIQGEITAAIRQLAYGSTT